MFVVCFKVKPVLLAGNGTWVIDHGKLCTDFISVFVSFLQINENGGSLSLVPVGFDLVDDKKGLTVNGLNFILILFCFTDC